MMIGIAHNRIKTPRDLPTVARRTPSWPQRGGIGESCGSYLLSSHSPKSVDRRYSSVGVMATECCTPLA